MPAGGRMSTRAPCRLPSAGCNDGFPLGSGMSPGPFLPSDAPFRERGTLIEGFGGPQVQRRQSCVVHTAGGVAVHGVQLPLTVRVSRSYL
jgi:hypothetical protein